MRFENLGPSIDMSFLGTFVITNVLKVYRTGTIITRGFYIFHCGLYCRAVSITDNLCTKQGDSSIFEPKIHGRVYNQEPVIMAHVR
jgi:hypothetical protein